MLYSKDDLTKRANAYCNAHGVTIRKLLGFGLQGLIFYVAPQDNYHESALKVHATKEGFDRELAVYKRLKNRRVLKIREFNIPQLLYWDDLHFAIEMSIVRRPFLLDFGGAYLDMLPPHAVIENECKEAFGNKWHEVELALSELEAIYGIYIADINTGNIAFDSD